MSAMNTDDDPTLRSYVLGQLPEEDAIGLDARMAEDDFRESVESIEEEILVEYFGGGLPAVECRDLLRRLDASPTGKRRIELARSLATVVAEQRPEPVPVPIPITRRRRGSRPLVGGALGALAAALVAVALLVPWTAPKVYRDVPVTGATRSADAIQELQVPPRAPVELRLVLPSGEPFALYTVSITREGHGTLWGPQKLKASPPGDRLTIDLPAGDLPDGIYEAEVLGVRPDGSTEAVGFPSFRVERR